MSRILTGDKLIESVRNRAMVPEDTSVYTDENVLQIANEELDVQLLDKLLSLHEEHLTTHVKIERNSEGVFDIPYRAIGNKLRDVVIVNGGVEYEMSQISIGELPDYSYDSSTLAHGMDKFYIESNQVKLIQPTRSYDHIKLYFYMRPSYLTKTSESAVITSIVDNGTEVTFSFSTMPSKFSSLTQFDFIGARTPNKIKAWDKSSSEVNSNLKFIKFLKTELSEELSDITVGDYICKVEESPVPNIPTEMHPVLAQLTAVHILEALGDTEGLANAQRRLERMNESVMDLVDDRVELAPKKIKPRHGTINETRSFYRRRRRNR